MDKNSIIKELAVKNDSKILLLVMDGVGGLPGEKKGQTALELAHTPNLDRLAGRADLGVHDPIRTGITPGSGPAHLGLFGYDPLNTIVGRGTLAALGVGFELQKGDVAARVNFCTLDENGIITDRRAGRIPSGKGKDLCDKISQIKKIEDVEVFFLPVKEYRAVLILRGKDLSGDIKDTDPQVTGVAPHPIRADSEEAVRTARILSAFVEKTFNLIKDETPANGLMLRGFDSYNPPESFETRYNLKPAAVANYPMYRGIARLVGMDLHSYKIDLEEGVEVIQDNLDEYDFFFFHVKKTDSFGEDGDIEQKAKIIEWVDKILPDILSLPFKAIAITGDHSTPARMKSHSWHPVPILIYGEYTRNDIKAVYNERCCQSGSLGRIHSTDILPLLLAQAGRLMKFGA